MIAWLLNTLSTACFIYILFKSDLLLDKAILKPSRLDIILFRWYIFMAIIRAFYIFYFKVIYFGTRLYLLFLYSAGIYVWNTEAYNCF